MIVVVNLSIKFDFQTIMGQVIYAIIEINKLIIDRTPLLIPTNILWAGVLNNSTPCKIYKNL